MNLSLKGVFATDSGMLAVWRPDHFQQVTDYDSWERELLEDRDIARHIAVGAFVPINIHSDGAFACEIRIGKAEAPAVLSDRERRYLTVMSQEYLFRSAGELIVSGIEYIEKKAGGRVGRVPVPIGDYAATVSLLAWDEEPRMKGKDGRPLPAALPDFLVILNPAGGRSDGYRKSPETFEKTA